MMSPQEILDEITETYSEHLEMMNVEEKFILIRNALAQKVALEMAMKDFYKSCFLRYAHKQQRINS